MSAGAGLEAVRDVTRTSSDPRARRTRSAILAATDQLIAEGATEFSVTSIARAAEVSRSVFYTHFSGIDDVAVTLLEAAVEEIGTDDAALRRASDVAQDVPVHIAVARIVAHAESHRALYAAVFTPGASFERAVEAYMRQVLVTIDGASGAPRDLDRLATARYISSGSLAVLIAWLRDEQRSPKAEITEFLVAILPPWFRQRSGPAPSASGPGA
jgi:AcrR family transcriptional regulator